MWTKIWHHVCSVQEQGQPIHTAYAYLVALILYREFYTPTESMDTQLEADTKAAYLGKLVQTDFHNVTEIILIVQTRGYFPEN